MTGILDVLPLAGFPDGVRSAGTASSSRPSLSLLVLLLAGATVFRRLERPVLKEI